MKDLFRFTKRFVPKYKKHLLVSVLANIASAFLNLLAFSLVMPILRVLFQIDNRVVTLKTFDGLSVIRMEDWKAIGEVLSSNFSYYISSLASNHGIAYTLMLLSLYLVIMTALKVGATYLGFYAMIPLRTGVIKDIRLVVYDKLLALPLAYFSGERKGDILTRISGDVAEVENSIMSSLDMMLKNPILIIVYLTTMILISWQLTLFVFLLLPVAGFIMGRVGKSLKKDSVETQNLWGLVNSMIDETLGGLRIVKAFTSEEWMSKRFEVASNMHRSSVIRLLRRQQLAHPMSELLGTITISIVLWYGGLLIVNGTGGIDASTFIYYLVIFYSLINPLKDLSKGFYSIRKGMGSMVRIDAILNEDNKICDPTSPSPVVFNKEIELRNVSFRYEDRWVLRDVNLTIPKGHTVALVGQSGGGKTTLVDLIPRFYDVVGGAILIDGVDIRDFKVRDLRGLIGNVNQEPILFNDTVANNISFGTDNVSPEAILEAARIAHVDEFVQHMPEGYDSNIGDRGTKLSGGQRQRLSIARAVFKNPPIMILDEATSSLDTASERLVQQALETLMQNRTTIVIAHRLSTVINADQICVLHEGRIVERGGHEELLALGGYYTQLYNMQLRSPEVTN